MTDLNEVDSGIEEVTALEEQMQSMVLPLRTKRDDLIAKKTRITEEAKGLCQRIDAQVRRIDAMLRASEPKVAQSAGRARPKQSQQGVSEELAAMVFEALKEMKRPVTARELHEAQLKSKYSLASVNNAFAMLRDKGEVRLAGYGPRNAKLYAEKDAS